MKIIVINGAGGVGKDTFVSLCEIADDCVIHNLSTVEFVKDIATVAGWDGRKDARGRKLLSDIKDALTLYDNIPYKRVGNQIELNLYRDMKKGIDLDKVIFFIHCREPEEIQKFKEEWNARTLLIRRPSVERKYDNHADKNVFYFDYDYTYDNTGSLDKVKKDAIKFMNFIKKLEWQSGKKLPEEEN